MSVMCNAASGKWPQSFGKACCYVSLYYSYGVAPYSCRMPHPQSHTLSAGVAVKRQRRHATAYHTPPRHRVGEWRSALV